MVARLRHGRAVLGGLAQRQQLDHAALGDLGLRHVRDRDREHGDARRGVGAHERERQSEEGAQLAGARELRADVPDDDRAAGAHGEREGDQHEAALGALQAHVLGLGAARGGELDEVGLDVVVAQRLRLAHDNGEVVGGRGRHRVHVVDALVHHAVALGGGAGHERRQHGHGGHEERDADLPAHEQRRDRDGKGQRERADHAGQDLAEELAQATRALAGAPQEVGTVVVRLTRPAQARVLLAQATVGLEGRGGLRADATRRAGVGERCAEEKSKRQGRDGGPGGRALEHRGGDERQQDGADGVKREGRKAEQRI